MNTIRAATHNNGETPEKITNQLLPPNAQTSSKRSVLLLCVVVLVVGIIMLLLKGTNFCVFCDLVKFAKFRDRKIYAACASGAALYSMRTLRAR